MLLIKITILLLKLILYCKIKHLSSNLVDPNIIFDWWNIKITSADQKTKKLPDNLPQIKIKADAQWVFIEYT